MYPQYPTMTIRILLFISCVLTIKGQKIGCGTEYNFSNWSCDGLRYYLSPTNVEKTLYCIGYNKLLSNDDKPSLLLIARQIRSFDKLDEVNGMLYFSEYLAFSYHRPELQFKTSKKCIKPYIEYPIKTILHFMPKSMIGEGIDYRDIGNSYLLWDQGLLNMRGNRVAKEPCKIGLHKYPFDWHICNITLKIVNTGQFEMHSLVENPVHTSDVLVHPGWKIEASNFVQSQRILVLFEDEFYEQSLTFSLKFHRNISSILMHFYLPSIILCIASMSSLFIHHDLLPARMSLSVTSCLSLITLIIGAKYVFIQLKYLFYVFYL